MRPKLPFLFPECRTALHKRGSSRLREMKWLGSYRYATINLGARDRDDLFRRFEAVCANLSFEPPARLDFGSTLNALRPGGQGGR